MANFTFYKKNRKEFVIIANVLVLLCFMLLYIKGGGMQYVTGQEYTDDPLLDVVLEPDTTLVTSKGSPENVIIVVIDGARYSETWGEPTCKYIPNMAHTLLKEGTLFTSFYNTGVTSTNPGHTAIVTGVNQEISNTGDELPRYPNLFQLWLLQTQKPKSSAWLITSKGKLNVLANTRHPKWVDKFAPATSCGVDGTGKGMRADAETLAQVKKVLQDDKPNLMLVNFKEPDVSGHANQWHNYLKGIQDTDAYVAEIWDAIQQSRHYKDNTLLLVTNDHGRHLDGHADGFVSHGDDCDGCRHISLFALGKNVRKNEKVVSRYNQTDISVTIAHLMGFRMPYAKGKVIKELLPPAESDHHTTLLP